MIIQNVEDGWISYLALWTNGGHQSRLVQQFRNNPWTFIGCICWLKSEEDSSRYARCRSCSIVSLRLSDNLCINFAVSYTHSSFHYHAYINNNH